MEKNGQLITPENWKKQIICPRCATVLDISWEDIHIWTTRKPICYYYQRITHWGTICQECGHKIEIEKEKIPYSIKIKAYNHMNPTEKLKQYYFY